MALGSSLGQDLLNVPMGDMIREMAFAIAEAQIKLDENSIEVAEMMGGLKTITNDAGDVTFEDSRVFFGSENVLLSNALDIHATTTDPSLKNEIEKKYIFDAGGSALQTNIEEIMTAAIPAVGTGTYQIKSTKLPAADITVKLPTRLSMLELGFTPTFYNFVDTIIEVRISITMSSERSSVRSISNGSSQKSVNRSAKLSFFRGKFGSKKNRSVTTSQVNATYASKYSYSAEGSSLLRTKLAPVPPPQVLEDRIRQLFESETIEVAPATS